MHNCISTLTLLLHIYSVQTVVNIHLAVRLVLEVVVVAAAASVEEQLAPRRGQVEVVPPQELGRVHRVARPGVLPPNIFYNRKYFS